MRGGGQDWKVERHVQQKEVVVMEKQELNKIREELKESFEGGFDKIRELLDSHGVVIRNLDIDLLVETAMQIIIMKL